MAIVARLVLDNGEADYVARYANCFRGKSESNVHAEEFLMRDDELLRLVRGGWARELRLYMTYQPCHHSGGRLPEDAAQQRKVAAQRANQGHPTSCSVRLREFCERELRPRGTALELVVADLYKVMWTAELMVERAPDALIERSTSCAKRSSVADPQLWCLHRGRSGPHDRAHQSTRSPT